MAADRRFKYEIVKECCRSLRYDTVSRQFSFPFVPSLDYIWFNLLSPEVARLGIHFYLQDFNNFLLSLERVSNNFNIIPFDWGLSDSEILNGEIVRLSFAGDSVLDFIKMENGQYQCRQTGRGYTFGSKVVFERDSNLLTAEGEDYGIIRQVSILAPVEAHLCIDHVFFKPYYRNRVSSSLWPLVDLASNIVSTGDSAPCEELLKEAIQMGVGSFPLLAIVNSVVLNNGNY